jgi:hypothetical protein
MHEFAESASSVENDNVVRWLSLILDAWNDCEDEHFFHYLMDTCIQLQPVSNVVIFQERIAPNCDFVALREHASKRKEELLQKGYNISYNKTGFTQVAYFRDTLPIFHLLQSLDDRESLRRSLYSRAFSVLLNCGYSNNEKLVLLSLVSLEKLLSPAETCIPSKFLHVIMFFLCKLKKQVLLRFLINYVKLYFLGFYELE